MKSLDDRESQSLEDRSIVDISKDGDPEVLKQVLTDRIKAYIGKYSDDPGVSRLLGEIVDIEFLPPDKNGTMNSYTAPRRFNSTVRVRFKPPKLPGGGVFLQCIEGMGRSFGVGVDGGTLFNGRLRSDSCICEGVDANGDLELFFSATSLDLFDRGESLKAVPVVELFESFVDPYNTKQDICPVRRHLCTGQQRPELFYSCPEIMKRVDSVAVRLFGEGKTIVDKKDYYKGGGNGSSPAMLVRTERTMDDGRRETCMHLLFRVNGQIANDAPFFSEFNGEAFCKDASFRCSIVPKSGLAVREICDGEYWILVAPELFDLMSGHGIET